jgi:Xaa-Pro aminopeptidase
MDYKSRTSSVVKTIKQGGADWFFVTDMSNVRYLSGFTGSSASLLISLDQQYILTDGRYTEQVSREVSEYQVVIQGNRKEMQAISDIIGDASDKIIWFEADNYTVARFTALQEAIPVKSFIPKRSVVELLRVVKEESEILALKQALKLAEDAFQEALDEIHEGMSERELARFLLDEMWRAGAVKESFDPLVLFGARSSMCHGKASDNKLKRGDVILMDFGCLMPDGYNSDITRTIFFGQPSDELKNMYQCVFDANRAAEEHICAGISGVEADEYARDVIRKAGRVDQFMHGLGHGVGLEIHESPRLSPLADHQLESGHVVTVEPGVYVAGTGGIRIEDMIVIRDNGCEIMNNSTKELLVL